MRMRERERERGPTDRRRKREKGSERAYLPNSLRCHTTVVLQYGTSVVLSSYNLTP